MRYFNTGAERRRTYKNFSQRRKTKKKKKQKKRKKEKDVPILFRSSVRNGYFYLDANGSRFGRNSVFYPEARALSKHRVASAPAAGKSQRKGGCNGVDKERHRSEFVTRVIADSRLVRPMPYKPNTRHTRRITNES